jgi:hypothetical protein
MQIERLASQPPSMSLRPVLTGRIRPAMSQKECKHLLPGSHQVHRGANACSHHVTNRFMELIRNPNSCQIARSMQDRQLLRIATIRLDSFSRLARNHRWCHDDASVPERRELPVDAVPTSTGFIAELDLAMSGQPLR